VNAKIPTGRCPRCNRPGVILTQFVYRTCSACVETRLVTEWLENASDRIIDDVSSQYALESNRFSVFGRQPLGGRQ
jgi:hypothetical protein